MDPGFADWKHRFYLIEIYKRRINGEPMPSEEDLQPISDAYEIPNAKFNPYIDLGYVFCLAEWSTSIMNESFIPFEFETADDVSKRIRELCK